MKKKKRKAFTDEKAIEIVQIIIKMIEEIKNVATSSLVDLADEEEIDSLFIKTSIDKSGLIYSLELFNSQTNTIAVIEHQIIETLAECQTGIIEQSLRMDIKKLYEASKKKIHSEITKILA